MEGKDVIKIVEELKKKKNEKALARELKAAKKREQKEVFLKCKNACICEKERCDAFGLRQCPNCHDVLRSNCSKSGCRVNGKCPQMILPASHSNCDKRQGAKRKLSLGPDESSSDD